MKVKDHDAKLATQLRQAQTNTGHCQGQTQSPQTISQRPQTTTASKMTDSILCHLGAPRSAKPQSLAEYGKLREQMIQKPWAALSEHDFIRAVTVQGCPFYASLMNGRDLMELQYEKLVWRTQSLVGLDFDVCEVSGGDMVEWFKHFGMTPWLGYFTFSNDGRFRNQSYRLLWRVETDLNLTYDECARALKAMRAQSGNLADKHANNPSRLWQGSNSGFFHYDSIAPRLDLRALAKK